MILLGKAVLREVPRSRFVGEVKCSQAMYDELRAAGGVVEMWKVGHSLIKARMKQIGAALAGEMSGHLFFAHRWLGFDDAIYAGARLLELLSRGDRTLRELADELPVMINTPEIRLDCPDDRKFAVVEAGHRAAAQRPGRHQRDRRRRRARRVLRRLGPGPRVEHAARPRHALRGCQLRAPRRDPRGDRGSPRRRGAVAATAGTWP